MAREVYDRPAYVHNRQVNLDLKLDHMGDRNNRSHRGRPHQGRRLRRASAGTVTIGLLALALTGCGTFVGKSSPMSAASSAPGSGSATASTATNKTPASEKFDPSKARKFVVVGSGDLMIHPSLAAAAEKAGSASNPDFYPSLASVVPRVKAADLAVCHVETPFSEPGNKTKFPHYYVHPNLAKAVAKVGFRECSTASNWTADKGAAGAKRTVSALADQGISQAGIRIPESQPPFTIRTLKGVKVAHISDTDPSDSPAAAESGWAVNRSSPTEIAQQAALARKQGAEIVIVSLAMGSMGSDSTSAAQEQAIRTITENGDVNLVIGHGSHTVQPAQKINGTWAIWHGNLISSFFPDQKNMHQGLLSQVTFKETARGVFQAESAVGYPVLAVPGSGKAADLAAANCNLSAYSSYWNQLQAIEKMAVSQGLILRKPCSG